MPDEQTTDDATQQLIQQIIAAGQQGQQSAPQSPIGVPYFQIDPATGQPVPDGAGGFARWTAHPQIGRDENRMDAQGRLVHAGGSFDSVPPRYFDGDQWAPASLPPEQLAALQKAMVQAGLLKPGQAQLGVWDQPSMSAYTELLAFANASGSDVATALKQWGTAHDQQPGGDIRAPLTVRVTNPDDLKAVFRKSVIDTLGQGWDSDKIDRMVAAYQGVETEAQQQQYAMTGSGSQTDPGTGGTVVNPPNPQTFAETQARQENPDLAQEHDSLGFIDAFNQLVGKWSG